MIKFEKRDNKNPQKRIKNFRAIPVFFALSLAVLLMVVTLILPKTNFSYVRGETLSGFPKPSIESIKSNSFSKSFEKYLSDHFMFKNLAVSAYNHMIGIFGSTDINDVFILKNRLIENIGVGNSATADKNIAEINTFMNNYNTKIPCYLGLIPTASELYKELLPKAPNILNQAEFITDMYSVLPESAGIDIYANLTSQKSENIFYNTDNRWTSYGAYIGYSTIIKTLGGTATPLDKFNIERAQYDFYGNLYKRTLIKTTPSDVISFYHSADGDVVESVTSVPQSDPPTTSVFNKDFLTSGHVQDVFLGKPTPVKEITTSNKNGKRLLIFRDAFANSMMQFLPMHYETITLVDLGSITESQLLEIDPNSYSSILFLYSVGNFISDNNIFAKLPILL